MTLPPLPKPAYPAARVGMGAGQRVYTGSEMRAYGAACAAEAVAAERGACAKLCETTKFTGNTFPVTTMEQLRMDIGAAIRARGTKCPTSSPACAICGAAGPTAAGRSSATRQDQSTGSATAAAVGACPCREAMKHPTLHEN